MENKGRYDAVGGQLMGRGKGCRVFCTGGKKSDKGD